MVLLLDNYDSFTYNLRDYILQCGNECMVVRNDELRLDEIEQLKFSSIILSPGPKTPKEAGVTMAVIDRFCLTKPILGICLGHQAIGEYFGAQLVKANQPVHGKTTSITHRQHYLFKNIPNPTEVMRYHSLILTGIEQTVLETIAYTDTQEIMAVAHPQLPIAGVQFHPESVLTGTGLQLLKNWFAHIG